MAMALPCVPRSEAITVGRTPQELRRRSSFRGGAQRRARNPFLRTCCRAMDSGLALRAPRNDNGGCGV
ncbi:MAG: hypothetical protein EKK32_26900 [Bradyrhizobiaceae bacterium]|nr:MAG: hypothetical protein EKK32_26900 [Bradyrhizobiaceae bacterium]